MTPTQTFVSEVIEVCRKHGFALSASQEGWPLDVGPLKSEDDLSDLYCAMDHTTSGPPYEHVWPAHAKKSAEETVAKIKAYAEAYRSAQVAAPGAATDAREQP